MNPLHCLYLFNDVASQRANQVVKVVIGEGGIVREPKADVVGAGRVNADRLLSEGRKKDEKIS